VFSRIWTNLCQAGILTTNKNPAGKTGDGGPPSTLSSRRLRNSDLSILLGVLAGVLFSVFATSNPLASFALTDLVIYAGIPILTGGLASLADPDNQIRNGIVVGFVSGLGYVTMDILRLTSGVPQNVSLFLVLTVPIWGLLGAMGSAAVYRIVSTPASLTVDEVRVCASCKTHNPPDASFCKNCGTKLA